MCLTCFTRTIAELFFTEHSVGYGHQSGLRNRLVGDLVEESADGRI
jgi:hypothetical protein